MNNNLNTNKNLSINVKFLFIFLYFSLFLGFYFNEDSSGSGGFIADFNNTWGYILALQNRLFVLPSEWVQHTPLHFLIISKLYPLAESKYLLRLYYCIFSFLIPLFFYKALKIKFSEVNKNHLFIFSCSIFLFPSFRSAAIWANDHLTALFFFIISIYYFVKWEKKNKIKYVYLQCLFLALTVYTRQYYALIFFFFLFIYFRNYNLKFFFKLCFFILTLSLPGFILIYYEPILLITTLDKKINFANVILVSSSILSFYLIPFYFFQILKEKGKNLLDNNFYFSLIFAIIFVIFLNNFFNYSYKFGGGFFLKLSYLVFDNSYFFLITSVLGITILTLLLKEDKINSILIIMMLIGFPAYMIYQKYYEPMFIFIFIFLIRTNLSKNFFYSSKNFALFYFYLLLYLLSALINDYFNLTKTILF